MNCVGGQILRATSTVFALAAQYVKTVAGADFAHDASFYDFGAATSELRQAGTWEKGAPQFPEACAVYLLPCPEVDPAILTYWLSKAISCLSPAVGLGKQLECCKIVVL